MAIFKVPFLFMDGTRAGRPRWIPSKKWRDRGFKGVDLKSVTGEWLDEDGAIQAAKTLNASLKPSTKPGARTASSKNLPARNLAAKNLPAPGAPNVRGAVQPVPQAAVTILPPSARVTPGLAEDNRTMLALIRRYQKVGRFTKRADATRRAYEMHFRLFEEWAGDWPVDSFVREDVEDYFQEITEARGDATANMAVAVLRRLFFYALDDLRWINYNPVTRFDIHELKGRLAFWGMAELQAFEDAALRLGRQDVADAVFLAAHSAQRQSDILALPLTAYQKARWLTVKQIKTKKTVSIPLVTSANKPTRLKLRIDAILARRPAVADRTLLICESTTAAWEATAFRYAFRVVRDEAAKLCPSIADKRFADLRDTAITWLALADCNTQQIIKISGHSPETADRILEKAYIAAPDQMATAAIDKLDLYQDAEADAPAPENRRRETQRHT